MIDGSGTINPAALNTPGITILPLHIHTFDLAWTIKACSIGDASAKSSPFDIRHWGDSHVISRDITKGVTDAGAPSF